MTCVRCGNTETRRDGRTRLGGQRWRGDGCGRRFTARSTRACSRHRLPDDVLALAVRWYARFRLSDADVAEWLAERGFAVDRTASSRWVQRFLPLFGAAARRHRRRVGRKWRVDETSCDFQGKQAYIYRAIAEDGQVVDACFSERRNAAAAPACFERALAETEVTPVRVTTDKATCYPSALRAVLPRVEHRRSKSLNNGLERDHFHLKQRLSPMRGFKRGTAADTLARGHALMRNLRGGFSSLTIAVAPSLRLATAWPQLAQAIEPPAAASRRPPPRIQAPSPAVPTQRQQYPRPAMTEEIADRVIGFMFDARLPPGDRLPAELNMMAQLGVAPTSSHEAIKALRALGAVDVVSGGMILGQGSAALGSKPLSWALLVRQSCAREAMVAHLDAASARLLHLLNQDMGAGEGNAKGTRLAGALLEALRRVRR